MECRNLEIMIHSATDLKELNLIGKMDPYVSVYFSGNPNSKQKTEVHTDGGKNPKWKGKPMKFVINDDLVNNSSSSVMLVFKIMAEKPFVDKEVGEVYVPVKDLLKELRNDKVEKFMSYSVRTPSGKVKGTLNFSYKLGEKFKVVIVNEPANMVGGGSSSVAHGGGGGGYPHGPPPVQYGAGAYPQPPQYGYPHAGYGGPQRGYEYHGAQPAPGTYGYPGSGGYLAQQVAKPHKKNKMGGMGLGLGAGLLGGLLIGDMVSDVGEVAAYDAGFADGADFDF